MRDELGTDDRDFTKYGVHGYAKPMEDASGDEWVMLEVDDRQRVFEKRGKEEDIVRKVYGNIKLRRTF